MNPRENHTFSRRHVLRRIGGVALLAPFVAACSQQAAPATSTPPKVVTQVIEKQIVVTATPAAAQTQTSSAAKVTLRLQEWFNADDMWAWKIGINAFRANHPNVDINLEFTPYDQIIAKTVARATAGDLPDVTMCSNEHTPTFIANLLLLDLGPYIKQDPQVKPEDFYAGVSQGFNMFGRWWGFPYDNSSFAIYYNKAMFDAAGVAYPPGEGKKPWTMEQLLDAARKLTNPSKGQWGLIFSDYGAGSQYDESNWIYTFGGRNFSDDLRKCLWDTKEVADAIQYRVDLIHKHKVTPPLSETQNSNVDYFSSQKAAMAITGQWSIINYNAHANFDYDVAYFPISKVQKIVTGGSGFAITANTKYKDDSWNFLKEYTSTQTLSDMIGSTGRSLPARKSATSSFLKAGQRPKHRNVHVDELEWTFNDRSILAYNQVMDARWRVLEPLYQTGQGDARKAVGDMAQAAQSLLDQAWSKAKIGKQ